MGYSEEDSAVRVDFFKPSGKWYCTEAVKFIGEWKASSDNLIHDAFKRSLREHFKDEPGRLSDMVAVCLEPYHEYSHPLMLKDWSK